MFVRKVGPICISLALSVPLVAGAADTPPAQPGSSSKAAEQQPGQTTEPIYGHQMMTPEEMAAYRNKMHSAKTAEERERLRAEHHREMQARAKERGITLPEEPPARAQRGQGMGPGMGMGPGAGASGGR